MILYREHQPRGRPPTMLYLGFIVSLIVFISSMYLILFVR